jgi:hypothetical protein
VALPSVLRSVVAFVRAGYPQGVPEHDYVPLFALLRRRLSEDEVREVADSLIAASPHPDVTAQVIRHAIESHIQQSALDDDVERVRRHLAEVGLDLDSLPPR